MVVWGSIEELGLEAFRKLEILVVGYYKILYKEEGLNKKVSLTGKEAEVGLMGMLGHFCTLGSVVHFVHDWA